jgi:lactoylglutathione lyase
LDPEGKKIEFIQKKEENWDLRSTFNHIMLRVGDLEKSVDFFKQLGMKEIRRSNNEQYKYTLAFIGYDADSTVLELTYNWGESSYDMGNMLNEITIVHGDTDKEVVDANGYKFKILKSNH